MNLILLFLGVLIVVLLILLARYLRQLLDLVRSQESRIAALEREREQVPADEAEPSSVFAFRPTEVVPPPGSASPSASLQAVATAAAVPLAPDGAEPQRRKPAADLPLQTSFDDLPLLHEPVAPVSEALDVEVARLRAQGLDRRAIAERLGVSEAEVERMERPPSPQG